MKILRNPIAVAVLAVVALAYTAWTLFGARGFRSSSSSAATTTAAGPAVPVPPSPLPSPSLSPTPGPSSLPASLPLTRLDLATIIAQAQRWIESPRRDPFRVDRPAQERPQGPPASDLLVLSAVWRQTGSQLAIINQQILREGEKLQGYAIETIEADSVWVRGTNGRERITFLVPNLAPTPRSEPAVAKTEVLPEPLEPDPMEPARGLLEPAQETITATLPLAPPQ